MVFETMINIPDLEHWPHVEEQKKKKITQTPGKNQKKETKGRLLLKRTDGPAMDESWTMHTTVVDTFLY